MTFTAEQLNSARKEGYSDDEIWEYLGGQDKGFSGAKQEGYSLDEVAGYFSQQPAEERDFFSFEDVFSAIGGVPKALAVGIPATVVKMGRGLEMPEESEFLEDEAEFNARIQQEQQDRVAAGKATSVGSAIREALPSLSFSLGSMGVAIPAGVAGSIVGGPAGWATGPASAMAASGVTSYRMAGADMLYRAFKTLEENKGAPLTDEEKADAYRELLPFAQDFALWEAGPEAVSNAITMGVGKFVFGFGKQAARGIVDQSIEKTNKTITRKIAEKTSAVVGGVGAEVLSEGVTAMGQFPSEKAVTKYAMTGEAEGGVTEYPGGYFQAVKDVAPATLATMAMMGTAAGGAKLTTLPFRQQKTQEQIEEDNIDQAAEREATNLSIPSTDETAKGIKASIDKASEILVAKKEIYSSLEPNDPVARQLGLEIRETEKRISEMNDSLESRVSPEKARSSIQSRIEQAKVELTGLEPTSRKARAIENKIAQDEAKLKALSEPIAAAEAEQARLAREIAAPVEEAVTPPVEPAAAPVSEPTQPTIREVPETSPIVGAEPTAVVEQEPVTPEEEAPAITPAPAAETPAVPAPAIQAEEIVGKKLFDAMGTLPQKANKAREALPGYTPVFKIGDFYDFIGEDAGLSGSTVIGTGKTAKSSLPYYQSSNLQEIANRTGKPIAIIEKTKVAEIIQPVSAPTPAAPAAEPAGIAVGNRIKLGKSPQTYTIEEIIPQTEAEKELGEQYYSVRNEKTGEVQTVEAKDIKPVKAKGARKVAARVKDESLIVPEAERYTFEQAEAEATKLFGGMPEGFVIVNDSLDKEFEFKAAYEPSTGNIILNLAYIRQGESVRNLIAHELGHYAAGDPEIRAKLQEFLDALPATTRAKLERFVDRIYNDETGDIRLEEKQVRAFIQMLKTGDQRNAFQNILDAIKKWLNDNLGTNFQPADMDAAAVLSGAINRFVSGEKIAREDGEMRRDTELSQMDADYLDAVERGDMETAQRMVDEAAKKAGYNIGPVYHGSKEAHTVFDESKIRPSPDTQNTGFFFGDERTGRIFGNYDPSRVTRRFFIRLDNPISRKTSQEIWNKIEDWPDHGQLELRRQSMAAGYDGAIEGGTFIVFSSNQIKSADPVTYDDAGNVIPLSQRFQPTQEDIRYAKVERSEDVEKDIAIAKQIQSVVDETIGKMPQDQARDYNAFVNEGKSEAQIAEENNTSVSQVRTNIVRGKKSVGDAIKKAKIDTKAKPENVVLEWTTGAAKKYLTKEGDLPGGTFQNWVRRNAKLAREAEEARQATQDFYEGLRKLYKINKIKFILYGLSSIEPEDVAKFNDALAGEIPISDMPVEIQEPLTRMRQHIDAMSSELIATGQLPEYLEAKAMNNLGVYLTRSYKIFSDPKWINKIPQEKLTAARNFLYQQQSKTDPNFTIEDADRKLEQMLNDWAGESDMEGKRGGRLGAKDLSVMMTRSEVPKQLRDVMGENTNIIFNYANTISKISRFVADQQFLDAVKKEGAGKFLFTKDAAPKGFNTLIAPEESRTMSPLSGLRTTPEIAKAFEEFGKAYDAKANPFLYAFGWLNAVGKANLTVGSLFTQARNLIGQPFFFLANGHADLRAINREVERIMKSKGLSKDQARNELVKMAAGEGLVNENAYAGELKEAFEQIGLKTFEDMDADEFSRQFVLLRLFKKGTQGAQKVYQKTDELGKLIGWLNETNRIEKMNPSMSREDAMAIASERTRNTYPTYSQGSEALRLFRRQPFFGPFATFFYETFRTTYWNAVYAFEDINSGTEAGKEEGIKRLAGTMAQIAIGAYLVNAISAMVSGIGDQEEEDVRRMLPPWAANASLVWFPKTKDGVYDFINFSSLNPYNALTDPFVRMMSGFSQGEDPTNIFIESVGTFLAPFTSEQPVTAATIDALRNVTERGTKVYNEEDDLSTKTSKILLHVFGKAFTPGTADRLRRRIIPAVYGETVGTRAPAPLKEISAEFTGVRFENMDMRQAFQNKAWEFNKAQNDSERIFRDVATRRRRVTEDEQIEAYRRAEESRFENWQEMYRNYMAVRRAGASKQEAVRLMTDIKISKREASYIARGKYVPYEVSDEVRRRSKLNGNVVPLQEIKSIAREMPRVLEDVR